jgi:hypothetical protein
MQRRFIPAAKTPQMLNNHIEEIRKCYQQAVQCVEQADSQTDSKVKKQFLELTRLCLLLAHGYEFS